MGWFLPAAIGAAVGFGASKLGDKSDSSVDFAQVPETQQATQARSQLMSMATGDLPVIPRRQIARVPSQTEESKLARSTAKGLLTETEQTDFMSLPEVQGILQQTIEQGDLALNRISRQLQATGNITSTTGRDVLGRAVTSVQQNIAAALAPFASEQRTRAANEKQRIQSLIPLLESLGLSEKERARIVEQANYDATFEQRATQAQLPFNYRKPLLESVLGLQPAQQPIIQGGEPSLLSQLAPIIGPALGGYLSRG